MGTNLTSDQKYIARLMLKLRIHESNGASYQDLFVRIMEHKYPKFRTVKPHGNIGDRKNDGFDNTTGTYYQVYAPIDIIDKDSIVADKMRKDFKGLVKHWNKSKLGVRNWYFVVNDKFLGVSPNIEKALGKIQKSYSAIQSDLLLSKDLVATFLTLDIDQVHDVLGGILPSLDQVGDVDFVVLTDVIQHLLHAPIDYSQEVIPNNPDFEEKIHFNNLSDKVGVLLTQGNYQSHVIRDYFKINGSYEKDRLRNVFSRLYNESMNRIKDQEDKPDLIFFDILEKSSPKNCLAVQNAVLILMAYFFEYCDIFEIPK